MSRNASAFLSHLGQDDVSISDQSSISRAADPNSDWKKEQGPWEPSGRVEYVCRTDEKTRIQRDAGIT